MIDNGFHGYQDMTDEEYRQMRMAESGEDIAYKREMTEPEDMQNEHFYPDEEPVTADVKSNPEPGSCRPEAPSILYTGRER